MPDKSRGAHQYG